MDLCGFFGVAPALFVLFRCFLCWRNANLAGRFAYRRCCRVSFCCVGFSMVCLVCEVKGFHTFCTLFHRFSHCQDRALERDRPQQREKKVFCRMNLFGRSFVGYLWVWAEGWRRFTCRSWKNVFEAWELFWSSLRSLKTFECQCVLLCTTLLRRRVSCQTCVVWLKSKELPRRSRVFTW